MREWSIGKRVISAGGEPFIIAEVGLNHNGNLDSALEMVDVAVAADVDAVKFQTFRADELCSDPSQTYTYRSQGKTITEPMIDMFRRCELSVDSWPVLKKKCDDAGVVFMSTPQNESDLTILLDVGVPAIKVGSDDFTNIPLLKSYAASGLPMIVSCGMADMGEVHQALDAIGTYGGHPTVLMLCTSQYPTPPEDVNLLKLRTLKNAFPGVPLGFSDHTRGSLAASIAVAFGACTFEKHFTLDHDLLGPDHWFSENPDGLTQWAASIRMAHIMMGEPQIRPTKKELEEMRGIARRSLRALVDIPQGTVLDKNNVGMRRPSDGLPCALYDQVEGKRAAHSITAGDPIQLGDIAR